MADKRLIKTFEEQRRRSPDAPQIVSEGDSWFSYPFHRNTIDHLDTSLGRKHRFCLLRLERNSDELLQILSGRQKLRLRRILSRYPIDALLMSGGGNDLLGPDLNALLRKQVEPSNPGDLLHSERVSRRLRQLRDAYRDLLAIRDDYRPACRIYAHGYDYPVASGKPTRRFGFALAGPWIRPALEDHGIHDQETQEKVLRTLLDAFNEMLAGLASTRRRFVHVDLRGTLSAKQWKDEVHPTSAGFSLVAEQFHRALAASFMEFA